MAQRYSKVPFFFPSAATTVAVFENELGQFKLLFKDAKVKDEDGEEGEEECGLDWLVAAVRV